MTRTTVGTDDFSAYPTGAFPNANWLNNANSFHGNVIVWATHTGVIADHAGFPISMSRSASGETYSADQYSEVTIQGIGGQSNDAMGCTARQSTDLSPNADFYVAYIDDGAPRTTLVSRINNDSETVLGSLTGQTWNAGDKLSLEVSGSSTVTLTAYRDSGSGPVALTSLTGLTDTSASKLTSGSPGVLAASSTDQLWIPFWSGGNLASGTSLTPSAGSAAFTGHAPTVQVSGSITPNAGVLAFAGAAAILSLGTVRTATAGALAFTGHAPTLSTGGSSPNILPAAGSLAFTGHAPSVTQRVTIAPAAGAAAFTGHAPTVTQGATITPNAGTLAFTGNLPSQTLTLPSPGGAALSFTGLAPLISLGTVTTPSAGAAAFTGHAPTVQITQPGIIQPLTGSLSFQGHAPQVLVSQSIQPGSASFSFTGSAPLVTQQITIAPAAGAVSFTGHAPLVTMTGAVVPGSASLSFSGHAPTVSVFSTTFPRSPHRIVVAYDRQRIFPNWAD